MTVAGFFTILRKMIEKSLLVEIKDPLERRINDKTIFRVTINFNGLKCGTPSFRKCCCIHLVNLAQGGGGE